MSNYHKAPYMYIKDGFKVLHFRLSSKDLNLGVTLLAL